MILALIRSQSVDVRLVIMATLATLALVGALDLGVFMGLPVLLVMPFLMTRVMAFELTVPLTARQVFAARLATSLALMLTPILLWAIAWMLRDPGTLSLRPIAAAAGGASLLAIAPLAWRPASAVSPRPMHLALIVATAAGTAALLGLFVPTAVTAAVLSLTFGAIVIRTWNALPPSYVMDPEVLASRPGVTAAAIPQPTQQSSGNELPLFIWFVRQHFSPLTMMLLFLVLIAGSTGGNMYFMLTIMAVVVATIRSRMLFAHIVPISFQQRFAAMVVAVIILPLFLMFTGSTVRESFDPHNSMYRGSPDALRDDYDADESASRVPFEFWKSSSTGVVAQVVAPWGEKATPWVVTFFGRTWYNPYSVTAGSSERFRDWQFERATSAVYGMPITRDEYKDRDALPPPVTRSASMTVLKGASAIILMLLLLAAFDASRVRSVNKYRVFRYVENLAFLTALAILIGPNLYYGQYAMDVVPSLVSRAFLQFVQQLSRPLPITGLVVVVSIAITWKFAEWIHSKTEIDKQDFVLNIANKR